MDTDTAWTQSAEDPNQYKAPVPCYNCGSPDHLFTACPEPTRPIPAGLAANAAKNAAREAKPEAWRTPDYGAKLGKKGHIVTKFPYKKPPVITRYAPPGTQQFSGNYDQAPQSYPPYYQSNPTPPMQSYDHYGQQLAPPVSQPHPPQPQGYDQFSQSGYPQAQYSQPAPQYPVHHPVQQAPHQNYQNCGYQNDHQNAYHHSGPQNAYLQPGNQNSVQSAQQHGQQHGYHNDENGYQNLHQDGYVYQNGYQHHGQQGPYQQNPQRQTECQQPDYVAYPQPPPAPPVTFYQNQGPAPWGQPAAAPYGQQQHGPQFYSATLPYYAQHQQHYLQDGDYNQPPPAAPYIAAGLSAPIHPSQQYAEAQYTPQEQFSQPSAHSYNGYSNNGEANTEFTSSFPEQPAYPPPSHDSSLAHGSRAGSIVSQGQSQGNHQPYYTETTDEEEMEWMLERHLQRRMDSSGIKKAIKDLTIDEYYALLSADDDRVTLADPIRQPLPAMFNEDLILPPAYGATCIKSKYITPENLAEFTKSVRDQPLLTEFARDPVFLNADIDTWCREYGRRVEYLSRASFSRALGVPYEPKSRKRLSSSHDEDSENQWDEAGHERPPAQVNQHKRPRANGASFKYKRIPPAVTNSNPVAEREKTQSPERESTPTFDLGEGAAHGEEDPWAVEPGESSIPQDHHQQPSDFDQEDADGDKLDARQSYNDRGSIHMTKNYGQSFDGLNDQSRAPKKQDSGYVSGRSSYTSNTGKHSNGVYVDGKYGHNHSLNQGNVGQRLRQSHSQDNLALESPMSSDSELFRAGASPLTPGPTELLNSGHALPLLDQAKSIKQGPQRQVDDVTPRLKRRQPHVEAAYSRRW